MTNELSPTPAAGSESENGNSPSDTRSQLLEAAIEVFLEKGYGSTRVQDIAQRAGYTAGALYVHFSGRAALLNEALSIEGNIILNDLIERLDTGEAPTATQFLSFAALGSGETSRFDLLLVEALAVAAREPGARLALDDALDKLTTLVDNKITDAKKAGTISTDVNEEVLRHLALTLLFGSVLVKNLGFPNGGPEATVEVLTQMTSGIRG